MEIPERFLSEHIQLEVKHLQELVAREPGTMQDVLFNQAVAGNAIAMVLQLVSRYCPDEISGQVKEALDLHHQMFDQFPVHKTIQQSQGNPFHPS